MTMKELFKLARAEGREAYLEGLSWENVPYNRDTTLNHDTTLEVELAKAWLEGFDSVLNIY